VVGGDAVLGVVVVDVVGGVLGVGLVVGGGGGVASSHFWYGRWIVVDGRFESAELPRPRSQCAVILICALVASGLRV
jgi:hypothetical protein